MSGRRPNVLVIVSDEHDPAVMGHAGHPLVRTPALDRLAREGYTFDNAYCNSPMCVPSRLSFFSGMYAHDIEAWDNGVTPGERGQPFRTWGHYLGEVGYETVLCGRTHFNGFERRHGFEHRLVDDMDRWQRGEGAPNRSRAARRGSNSHVSDCGPGESSYNDYDRGVTDAAVRFLEQRATGIENRPWLLYCGLMRPHFPLRPPPEYYAEYDAAAVPLPATWREPLTAQHPVIQHLRWNFRNDEPITEALQREATACYLALVAFLDDQLGRLLAALDTTSLRENTVVIYSSDHGEAGGQHGIWQKQCFYEPAVRVPLLARVPAHMEWGRPRRVRENVSLVDILPTLLDLAGAEAPSGLRGASLRTVAAPDGEGDGPQRAVFSEYHAQGMLNGGFMLKLGALKYCYYVGERPQLFDTARDPLEVSDAADDAAYADARERLHDELLRIVDPEAVDARAKADQRQRRTQRDAGSGSE